MFESLKFFKTAKTIVLLSYTIIIVVRFQFENYTGVRLFQTLLCQRIAKQDRVSQSIESFREILLAKRKPKKLIKFQFFFLIDLSLGCKAGSSNFRITNDNRCDLQNGHRILLDFLQVRCGGYCQCAPSAKISKVLSTGSFLDFAGFLRQSGNLKFSGFRYFLNRSNL